VEVVQNRPFIATERAPVRRGGGLPPERAERCFHVLAYSNNKQLMTDVDKYRLPCRSAAVPPFVVRLSVCLSVIRQDE